MRKIIMIIVILFFLTGILLTIFLNYERYTCLLSNKELYSLNVSYEDIDLEDVACVERVIIDEQYNNNRIIMEVIDRYDIRLWVKVFKKIEEKTSSSLCIGSLSSNNKIDENVQYVIKIQYKNKTYDTLCFQGQNVGEVSACFENAVIYKQLNYYSYTKTSKIDKELSKNIGSAIISCKANVENPKNVKSAYKKEDFVFTEKSIATKVFFNKFGPPHYILGNGEVIYGYALANKDMTLVMQGDDSIILTN